MASCLTPEQIASLDTIAPLLTFEQLATVLKQAEEACVKNKLLSDVAESHSRLLVVEALMETHGATLADLLARVTALETPLPPPTFVLWRAGYEGEPIGGNVLSEWYFPAVAEGGPNQGGGEYNSGGGNTTVTDEQAHSGTKSAKMVITATGSDAGTRLHRFLNLTNVPSEAYYSSWYYFPRVYTVTNSYWAIFQFKARDGVRNDPIWLGYVDTIGGQMFLYLTHKLDGVTISRHRQTAVALPVGRWVHIETFLRQSSDGTGQITVWQDGVEILNVPNATTKYPGSEQTWGVINYSNGVSPSPTVIYTDDAAISLTKLS